MIDETLRNDVLRFLVTECHAISPLRQIPHNMRNGVEEAVGEEAVVIRTRDDFDQFMRRCDYAKKTFHRGATHTDDSIIIVVAYHQPDSFSQHDNA